MEEQELMIATHAGVLTKNDLPSVNFSHILNLTDKTGIIQHAIYELPNRKEGYCIDDNSRALMLVAMSGDRLDSATSRTLVQTYLGFIHYMQNDDGRFRNFLCYDHSCPEKIGSEDSFGRTIMALGYLISSDQPVAYIKAATEMLVRAAPHCDDLNSLRGKANSLIGLCKYELSSNASEKFYDIIHRVASRMADEYEQNRDSSWQWYENILTYDNAILPLALLYAYEVTGEKRFYQIGIESLNFLESNVIRNGILVPVGNMGWLKRGEEMALFDQQGIDAMAMVLCYQKVLQLTRDENYLDKMKLSYQWFLGSNMLSIPLYDPITGGCADGLQEHGINFNYGAESTLAYWISHMAISETL